MRSGFVACLLLVACAPSAPDAREQRFLAAQGVINERCLSCHTAFAQIQEEAWLNSGYLTPGDASQSVLYGFLRGAGVGGPETMPRTRDISEKEREVLRAWIDGMPPDATASDLYGKANLVIRTQCATCHRPETGLANFRLRSEREWINSGFVVVGDSAASPLYRRIVGAGVGGDEDMPFDLPPLSEEERASVAQWIDTMGKSAP